MRHLIVPALAFMIAGCSVFPTQERCRELGCIEKAPLQNAPLGAELSFSQCNGQALYSYEYRRERQGWTLRSYAEEQSPICQGSP